MAGKQRKEVIYFAEIQNGTGLIKIGYTKNLEQRLQTLSRAKKASFKILGTIEIGDRDLERSVHHHFAHIRFLDDPENKELFKPEKELLDFIKNPIEVTPAPKTFRPKKSSVQCLAKVGYYRCTNYALEGYILCGQHMKKYPPELATDDTFNFRAVESKQSPPVVTG